MRKFRKCFITGVTGSGGSFLAEHILKKKIKVYGTYRSFGYFNILKKNKFINLKKIDLNNYHLLKKYLLKIKPDVIFHFASNADVRKSFDYPKKIIENNNAITLNLLESIRVAKLKPIIIICSTSEVYGSVHKNELPISEKNKIAPINPYAASKTFQDLIAQVYFKCYSLKIIITRMFTYNNPRRKNLFQTAFAKQIIEIERGKKSILEHGNLNSLRTSLDIQDAMEAYWLAATKGKVGEIYNISGKTIISVKRYLEKLISLSNCSIKTKLNKKLLRKTDINFQISSCSKFKRQTGWKEKVEFNLSVRNLLEYVRKNY
jgi:GDP-4-dehydro-6-deoxy-D-mannose reductase